MHISFQNNCSIPSGEPILLNFCHKITKDKSNICPPPLGKKCGCVGTKRLGTGRVKETNRVSIKFVIFRNFLEQYKYGMLLDCKLESLQRFRNFVSRCFMQTLISLTPLFGFLGTYCCRLIDKAIF